MMRTGLAGQACAAAPVATLMPSATVAAQRFKPLGVMAILRVVYGAGTGDYIGARAPGGKMR